MPKKTEAFKWGLAVFLTAGAILIFYDTLTGDRIVLSWLSQLMRALKPVIYGAMMAYLLAPVENVLENRLFRRAVDNAKNEGRLFSRRARAFSVAVTWIIILLFLYLLLSILLPELYQSLKTLYGNMETYYATVAGWVEGLLDNNAAVETWVSTQIENFYNNALTWVRTEVLPHTQTLVSALSGGVVSTLLFLKDLLVGIIVSIYFLAARERSGGRIKKVAYAVFSSEQMYWILRGARKIDRIFSGFVRGKLLDSLIIGVLCFIGCSIARFPYTPLISVIVGVTNIIPFFGPFLGAIPSAFLILLVKPIQAVYFLIFVLFLQQLDGNVIGPRILGDSTGLSSIWVIVAILVGGSFFGIPGMFFGVPVCACLYSLVTFLVDNRLRRKDLPLDTGEYVGGREPSAASSSPVPPEPAGKDTGDRTEKP